MHLPMRTYRGRAANEYDWRLASGVTTSDRQVGVSQREALLKPEYRDWYPGIVPGIWYNAGWLTAAVLEQQRRGEPRWNSEGRFPSDAHFEFRGGRPRSARDLRTRASDSAVEYGG